jgi:hypothetical protein
MDKVAFIAAYGKVVKMITERVKFIVKKEYLGTDGKWDTADLILILGQIVPMVMTFEDFKTLFTDAALFIDPSVKAELQKAFEDNFTFENETVELVTEEIHDVVLSIIKIIIKLAK